MHRFVVGCCVGGEATTTKVRNVIATLERLFESDEIPPAEDVDLMSCGSRRRSMAGWWCVGISTP